MNRCKKAEGDEAKKSHKIGIRELTLITFFIICAGPYGIEETIQSTGPFYALLSTALLPVLLSFPLSLICSEMGSIFPYRGSTVMWSQDIIDSIREKLNLHNPVGTERRRLIKSLKYFQILNHLYANTLLLKAICCNAILPALICGYIETLAPEVDRWYWRYLVSVLVFVVIDVLNLYGLDFVGWTEYFFAAAVITPVVLFSLLSLEYWEPWKVSVYNKPDDLDFGLLFSNLVWECTGFDQSTNMSGEVHRPNVTYPISLCLVVVLVIICFFVPLISGVMVQPDHRRWDNGAFSQISLELPGCENGWLEYWLILAGGISSMSVLNGYVTCTSRELYRNAKTGILPFGSWIAKLVDCRTKKNRDKGRIIDRRKRNDASLELYEVPDQQHSSEQQRRVYEFTINELTRNESEALSNGEVEPRGSEVNEGEKAPSDTSVPLVAILCVSVLPTSIQFLSFEQLLTYSSFLIASSMFYQLIFYIYARHGVHGYYNRSRASKRQFHLAGGLTTSILVCITPIACVIVLWVSEGWKPLVLYITAQAIALGVWGTELLVKRRKKARRQQQFEGDGYDVQTNEIRVSVPTGRKGESSSRELE